MNLSIETDLGDACLNLRSYIDEKVLIPVKPGDRLEAGIAQVGEFAIQVAPAYARQAATGSAYAGA